MPDLTVREVWIIPADAIPELREKVWFSISSDGKLWNAGAMVSLPKKGAPWSESRLDVDKKYDTPDRWEKVRLYAIKHFLPMPPPLVNIPYFRFKNLVGTCAK